MGWFWTLWIQSVFWNTINSYKTTVSWTSLEESKAVQQKMEQRIESMKPAVDYVSWSAWEEYTSQWLAPSVNQKIWSILNITV